MSSLTTRQQAGLNNLAQATEDAKLGDKIQALLATVYGGELIPTTTVTTEYPIFEAMGTVVVSGHGGIPAGGSSTGAAQQTFYGATSGNSVLLRADLIPTAALAAAATNFITVALKVRRKGSYSTAVTLGSFNTNNAGGNVSLVAWTPQTIYTTTSGLVLNDGDVLTLSITCAGTGTLSAAATVALDFDAIA